MGKAAWTPWHQVVQLRDDLKSANFSLSMFAADLYEVMMGTARHSSRVYLTPRDFFSLTYPTFNLRELARDVVWRLAGKNDKTVRQLELTYGGGKTHTLITLYHLVHDPDALPADLPAVQEFLKHIDMTPPKASVVVLAFDKLDVEKGMEVRGPDGEKRWLKNPWSIIAFQIAGADGLRLLHAEGRDEERGSAPAENLMAPLLALPEKRGLATLVLLDEVLTFAREKIGFDPAWRGRLVNFFQYLTQAATKVDRCAIVASLLATDPGKSDKLGKEIAQEMYAIFKREREEGVQPVVKEDVAEVLRRRFFKPESILDREGFRPHVVAALKGVTAVGNLNRNEEKAEEERFLRSYPFHPDLTDVFYSKWTNLEGFQRTRGILRTLALALRDAQSWDECPLVGPNVFLAGPDRASSISEAARELTTVAATEEYEGRRQEWTGILESELEKARAIQKECAGMRHREIEQGVIATFLHSQPIGQKASTQELRVLLGAGRPDKIELEKALRRWTEVSWFLDEGVVAEVETGPSGEKQLPKSWRLGSKPNLKQMHDDARGRVSADLIEAKLLDEIGNTKSLTTGAAAAGAKVHNLPDRPSRVEDDGEFRYVVLGPKAASESGKPSPEAKRFINETTAADRPRVYRNAVVLAAPSRDGLEAARNCIRDYLAWEDVRAKLGKESMGETDPIRWQTLLANIAGTQKMIRGAIEQAYSIVVTVSDKNEIQAFKIAVGDKPLFEAIKSDERSRIQDTAVRADALLPGGPYDLWREGETARRVKDLVGAFAQFTQLPKMLNRQAILETLVDGCREGIFVLRLTRPDRSVKTYWRELPDEAALKDAGLEVVLPEAAELTELPARLLAPGTLPGLWPKAEISVRDVCDYFAGGRVVQVPRESYTESMTIPKAARAVVETAIEEAVKGGSLWLTSGPASILLEEIPAGVLTDDAQLLAPPPPIPVTDILPENLPNAWRDGATSALAILTALSQKTGKTLPWASVRNAIAGAINSRQIECKTDSGPWPCDFAGAQNAKFCKPSGPGVGPTLPPPVRPGVRVAEAELRPNQIQDLADQIGEITKAAAGLDLKFRLRVELGAPAGSSEDIIAGINAMLKRISKDLELQ